MSINALKCHIQVVAGLVPNEPLAEWTRVWTITSAEEEAAQKDPLDCRALDKIGAANNYAAWLQNPSRFNWVQLTWTWV